MAEPLRDLANGALRLDLGQHLSVWSSGRLGDDVGVSVFPIRTFTVQRGVHLIGWGCKLLLPHRDIGFSLHKEAERG